jgi:hypothetical protein
MAQVLVFASGSRPPACHHGHPWAGSGTMLVGWTTCECPAAQRNGFGHHWIRCLGDGERCPSVWTDPACDHR